MYEGKTLMGAIAEHLLEILDYHLSDAGCNDMPQQMIEAFPQEEWDKIAKEAAEINCSPDEYEPGHPVYDFECLAVLRKRLESILSGKADIVQVRNGE